MIELNRIPEAQGIIGAYDVRVSDEGELVTWHRTGLRRRDETDWISEVIVPVPDPAVSGGDPWGLSGQEPR